MVAEDRNITEKQDGIHELIPKVSGFNQAQLPGEQRRGQHQVEPIATSDEPDRQRAAANWDDASRVPQAVCLWEPTRPVVCGGQSGEVPGQIGG